MTDKIIVFFFKARFLSQSIGLFMFRRDLHRQGSLRMKTRQDIWPLPSTSGKRLGGKPMTTCPRHRVFCCNVGRSLLCLRPHQDGRWRPQHDNPRRHGHLVLHATCLALYLAQGLVKENWKMAWPMSYPVSQFKTPVTHPLPKQLLENQHIFLKVLAWKNFILFR